MYPTRAPRDLIDVFIAYARARGEFQHGRVAPRAYALFLRNVIGRMAPEEGAFHRPEHTAQVRNLARMLDDLLDQVR